MQDDGRRPRRSKRSARRSPPISADELVVDDLDDLLRRGDAFRTSCADGLLP